MEFNQTWVKKWSFPFLFFVYVGVGLLLVPEYGVTTDEPLQRDHGLVTMDYIEGKLGLLDEKRMPDKELSTYRHRYYGMWFQLISVFGEEQLGLETFHEQHLLRHYLLFAITAFCSIFFFHLTLLL